MRTLDTETRTDRFAVPWLLLGAAAVAVAVLVVVPLVDGQSLISFTADDAYISFRYSDNFAHGHGPVWNLVGPRVDGYTSALWMALLALPTALGADPVVAAKVLGLAALAGIGLLLVTAGGRDAPIARAIAVGALALSPAFLTLTVQGMETAAAALMATLVAWLLVRAVADPGPRRVGAFGFACFLAVLARPDLVPYVAVCVLGLAVWLVRGRDRRTLLRAGGWLAGALLVPGLAWALWRWSYYGYPLPNTAYAKRSTHSIDPAARHNVVTFVTRLAWPYLLGLAVLAVRALRPERRAADAAFTWAVAVALVASGVFLAAGLFFSPIQGDLWRFQMPVYPVLLLCAVLLAARDPLVARLGTRGGLAARALPWAAATLAAAFALTTLGETRTQVRGRWVYDREQVGRALAPLAKSGMSMFVSESGALPYYAHWRASDLLGLNDHAIAVDGPRPAHIAALNPDLVQFVINPGAPPGPAYDAYRRLLAGGGYELALATVKTNPDLRPGVPPQAHLYFVRRSAPQAGAVLAALRGVRHVLRVPDAQARQIAAGVGYSR